MNNKVLFFILVLVVPFCISCPTNCLYCLKDNVCQACSLNHALNLKAACIPKTISNCRVQLNASDCSICEPTFTVSNGKCIKDYSGCISRNSKGECDYCWYGTRLISKRCAGLVNCRRGDFKGDCIDCMKGYNLTQGICVDNGLGCSKRDEKVGVCMQCARGFVMNGFTCGSAVILPPMCSLFNYQRGLCLICNVGYQNYRKYCQRKDQIPPLQAVPLVTNSLAMQVDILDGRTNTIIPTPTFSLDNSRVSLTSYQDIEVRESGGSGMREAKNNCWIVGNNGSCSVCLQGFYLLNGRCSEVTKKCLSFNSKTNQCGKCVEFMFLENGMCSDDRCAISIFSRCTKCISSMHEINSEGICLVSNCAKYLQGQCTACSKGFILTSDNLCSSTPQPTRPITPTNSNLPTQPVRQIKAKETIKSKIVGCDLQLNGECARCFPSFYPNGVGGCKKVLIGCLKLDANELNCLQCIAIYQLTKEGQCLFEQTSNNDNSKSDPIVVSPTNSKESAITQLDPSPPVVQPIKVDPYQNCRIRNNGSCAFCNDRYFLSRRTLTCVAIPSSCNNFNRETGLCISCQPSFNLFEGSCLSRFLQLDPNCLTNNIFNFCIACKSEFFKKDGRCLPMNTQCRTSNQQGGQCLTCYSGYFILNGNCVQLSQQPSCELYDFQQNCKKCRQRYYLTSLVCYGVNPLCFNYDEGTGACQGCVQGYAISAITLLCQTVSPTPPNCQTADAVGNCQQCNNRFFLIKSENKCSPVPSFCQNFNKVGGRCSKCFVGYTILSDNSCVKQEWSVGCMSGGLDGSCVQCSAQFVATKGGGCLFKDNSCLTYVLGDCTKCANLHYLKNGRCIKQVTKKQKDPNCNIHDIMNYCQNCNQGYYIDAGSCILADQLCKKFEPSNGYCTSCYDGYRLNKNKCYINSPITNCKDFNGVICLQCLPKYTLTPDGSCL